MQKKPIIELRDVWKTYRMEQTEVNALRGVSFAINEDEFVSIQGPSGSGKSTLMHLVGCLDLPTKGQVLLDGHDISKLKESALATIRGKRIGFVFQAFNLIPTLTAMENVMLPMIFNNVSRWQREKTAAELLDDMGLKDRMHHKPNQMSGGEQQRVAIARALSNDPEVILADEPTGNLDSNTGKHIMDLIMHLSTVHKKTIIMVTHDPYIASFAKKKIVIVDGEVGHDHEYLKRILWKNGTHHGGKK
ncbi:MAG: ABC transporter ATP-binding protein [Candidatus Nanoarchaeia archaeon]|nr:ABC transporter ATP-binding protein [Candidatus Nanoarchaeia archaeon]